MVGSQATNQGKPPGILKKNTLKKATSAFKGTPYFASNAALINKEIGAKDDLESLMYVIIYFLKQGLPWSKNIPVLSTDFDAKLEVRNVIEARNPD